MALYKLKPKALSDVSAVVFYSCVDAKANSFEKDQPREFAAMKQFAPENNFDYYVRLLPDEANKLAVFSTVDLKDFCRNAVFVLLERDARIFCTYTDFLNDTTRNLLLLSWREKNYFGFMDLWSASSDPTRTTRLDVDKMLMPLENE